MKAPSTPKCEKMADSKQPAQIPNSSSPVYGDIEIRYNEPELIRLDEAIATEFNTSILDGRQTVSGAIYDQNGNLVPSSQRISGRYGDLVSQSDPSRLPKSNDQRIRVPGTTVYLGHYMAHYGHFLVESLSSLWYLLDPDEKVDRVAFHPFVFGNNSTSYARACFAPFGIKHEDVLWLDQAVSFERVLIPERLINLNQSANKALKNVYQKIANSVSTPETKYKYVYISRSKNSRKKLGRALVNEPLLESSLSKFGFKTIYPEELPFEHQVDIYKNADVIAGISGSALHNAVFMKEGATLIEIGDLRSPGSSPPMQRICCDLMDLTHHFLPFSGRELNRQSQVGWLSIHSLVSQLNTPDSALPLPPPGKSHQSPPPKALLETGFLAALTALRCLKSFFKKHSFISKSNH